MCAIYAFMRHCDDLSDNPGETEKASLQQSIAEWRLELGRALSGHVNKNPIWPAFCDTVERYSIPHRFLAK